MKTASRTEVFPGFPKIAFLRALLAGLLVGGIILVFFPVRAWLLVELELDAGGATVLELHYASASRPYSPTRRTALPVQGGTHSYAARIESRRGISRVRFDLGASRAEFRLGSIALMTPRGRRTFSGPALREAMTGLHELQLLRAPEGTNRVRATGQDPFFELEVPPELRGEPRATSFLRALAATLLAVGAWLLLEWIGGARSLSVVLKSKLAALGGALTGERTIRFTSTSVGMLLLTAIAAVAFVALKLHLSSIGIWESMYPAQPVAQLIDLGHPRPIRSDEWNTQTPWVLNQVKRGLPLENGNVGGERAPLLTAVPVAHITHLVQPKFWGFTVFGMERGFSWWWAYKVFGLCASFFLLLLIVTRGDALVSAAGAAWVYGSSFVQWWFSSHLPEILIAFAMIVVGSYYLAQSQRTRGIVFGSVVLALFIPNLVLHLYPPFIIPLAYMGVLILIGLGLQPRRLEWASERLAARGAAASAALIVAGAVVAYWVMDGWSTIQLMLETVYPGHRRELGGDYSPLVALYGYFEGLRLGEAPLPLRNTNASEASSFVLLFPLLLLLIPLRDLMQRQNRLLGVLVLFCWFVLVWMVGPLPGPVREVLASAGWAFTSPGRAVLALGVASILAATVAVAGRARGDLRVYPVPSGIVAALVATGVGGLGLMLRDTQPEFFTSWRIAAGAVLAGAFALAITKGNRALFVACVLGAIAPGLTVNPLTSGLAPILEKPILQAARLATRHPDESKWAVIGDFVFAQGLKAHGLAVLNGSHFAPNARLTQVLDPAGKYEQIWNRYAHVTLLSDPGRSSPRIELFNPDHYAVYLDICSGYLPDLGVAYLAYTSPPPVRDQNCLERLSGDAASGVSLFRYKGM